jgi:hypothetical protein
MAEPKIGLVREDHHLHTGRIFSSLFEESNFSDVTLACEDNKQIRAHKVVISSGSQFFNNVLLQNPHPNPLIYLKISYAALQAILQFIYLGQCQVELGEVEGFLAIARELQVEGIAGKGEANSQEIWQEKEKLIDQKENGAEEHKYENLLQNVVGTYLKAEEQNMLKGSDVQPFQYHDIPKPFQCDECGKGFLQEKSLNNHKKSHKLKRIPKFEHKDTGDSEYLKYYRAGTGKRFYDQQYFTYRLNMGGSANRTHYEKRNYRCLRRGCPVRVVSAVHPRRRDV